jgi:hypothetical protein
MISSGFFDLQPGVVGHFENHRLVVFLYALGIDIRHGSQGGNALGPHDFQRGNCGICGRDQGYVTDPLLQPSAIFRVLIGGPVSHLDIVSDDDLVRPAAEPVLDDTYNRVGHWVGFPRVAFANAGFASVYYGWASMVCACSIGNSLAPEARFGRPCIWRAFMQHQENPHPE